MKLFAKVRINEKLNAEYLINAFFEEFNPESSIEIKGNDATVEIAFDNPPSKCVRAIGKCEILEFKYGKLLGEYQKKEEGSNKTCEPTEQIVTKEEIPELTEQLEESKAERDREKPKKKATRKVCKVKAVNIPQLEEIAKKATSFKHFVTLVAEWLEVKHRQKSFEELCFAATKVEEMSWKELDMVLKNNGIVCSQWDKISIGQQISKKNKDNGVEVTSLPFLSTMVQYKDYLFKHEEHGNEKIMATSVEKEDSVEVKEESTIKRRVKMECMPEIQMFEEVLGSVDKTQPIEDRVRYVLTAMGWNKQNTQKQYEIFEIANTAVRVAKMDFENIFLKSNIPVEDSMKARMDFSKFINDFASEYDSAKKVKLLDFLKQLQETVMLESEIKNS